MATEGSVIEQLTEDERHALTDSAMLATEGEKALRIIDAQAERINRALKIIEDRWQDPDCPRDVEEVLRGD